MALCHRPSRAAEQYALLSSQSMRTHSHCSVLATGRDELVLPRSRSDPTKRTQREEISRQVQFRQSRLQLCNDSRRLRRLTRGIYSQILCQFVRKMTQEYSRVPSRDLNYRTDMRQSVDIVGWGTNTPISLIAMLQYVSVLPCMYQSTAIMSKIISWHGLQSWHPHTS